MSSHPPPSNETADWSDPDDAEVLRATSAMVDALGGLDAMSDVQQMTVAAITRSMTGRPFDLGEVIHVDPDELAEVLQDRAERWRRNILHVMLIGALILDDIPIELHDRIEQYARALGIDDDMLDVTRQLAAGSRSAALADFQRSGYEGAWSQDDTAAVAGMGEIDSIWQAVEDDDGLAQRWDALQQCPPRSLGRAVWEFYTARGFAFPGRPGSAPPLLAQHDWVHVLAGYGSTVESEIEVFSFIAMANEDPRSFSLQAMVLSLFESGNLATGAGLFESASGHLSAGGEQMATRMGDAMRRGMICGTRSGGNDLLAIDWFSLAGDSLEDVRRSFHIAPKAQAAWESGSVTAWERGGISSFQAEHGRRVATETGHEYLGHGATPVDEIQTG